MNRFEGKVCLVTASSAGIGYAIAERMAQEGGHVFICSRKQENVDQALTKINTAIKASNSKGSVAGLALNVGDAQGRQKILDLIKEKHGRLDVLVPNAACSTHFGNQLEINERAYDKMWELNVKSTFFLIKESKALMTASGKGASVLVVSSVTG